MTSPQPSTPGERTARRARRSRTTLAALLFGVPLSALILAFIHLGPLPEDASIRRYVSHNVECIEVVMFCAALGVLGTKLWNYRTERDACHAEIVPSWDGQPVPVAEARKLLAGLQQLPARFQGSLIVRRVHAVLDFLCSRRSAAELDDHLRSLADNDALALEESYSLTRFITWAIPILGFLGTVLGITKAIAGVTPERLENDLSTVTDGLALAFDTTALALGLTMLTMFLSYLVERAEQSVFDLVDRYTDRELAHRFERLEIDGGQFVEVVRQQSYTLLEAVEQLVHRQANIWAQALVDTDVRRTDIEQRQQQSLSTALQQAMEQTLDTHNRRLAAVEAQVIEQSSQLMHQLGELAATVRENGREQQTALAQVTQALAVQLESVARLQESDRHLRRLQETLNQNLATLAGVGTFEQAIHSLTAAIHLFTARSAGPVGGSGRLGPRSGAAA